MDVFLQNVDIPKLILKINQTRNSTSADKRKPQVKIFNSTIGYVNITGNYDVHVESCIMNVTDKQHLPTIVTNGCNLTVNNSVFYGTVAFQENQSNNGVTAGIILATHGKLVKVKNTEFRDIQFSGSAIVVYQSHAIHIRGVHFQNCTAPKGTGKHGPDLY